MPKKKTNGEIPLGGELLSKEDLAADFKCCLRQIDNLEEAGRIRFFKLGRLKRTTTAERDRLVAELIREWADRNAEIAGEEIAE